MIEPESFYKSNIFVEKMQILLLTILRIKVETKRYENMLKSFSSYRTENIGKYEKKHRSPMNFEFEKHYLRHMDEYKSRIQNIEQLRSYIFEAIATILKNFVEIQQLVIDDLHKWKYEAQKLANDISFPVKIHNPDELDAIQVCLNELYERIMDIRTVVQSIHSSNVQAQIVDDRDEKFKENISIVLGDLITSSFVIENHPRQIAKIDTRNNASVRMLITKFTNVFENLGVYVSILSESQAAIQTQQKAPLSESSGCMTYNTEEIKFPPDSDTWRWNFNRMMVTKVKRKAAGDMTDKKFFFLFRLKFQMNDFLIDIWTMSMPMVVFTFSAQEPKAWASILWHNTFSINDGNRYSVVDKVSWPQLASVLNARFKHRTGLSLTKEHFDYLYKKLNPNPPTSPEDDLISFSLFQLCKDPLPGQKFTFYEWFHGVMKLIQTHLLKQWQAGLIIGFVGKEQAEQLLLKCTPGTFLLRFTDSIIGGVSITAVGKNDKGELEVCMYQPFCQEGLDRQRSRIFEAIQKSSKLTHLYPNVSKEIALPTVAN